MVWTRKMTCGDYERYLQDMMELQLWYALRIMSEKKLSFAEAVNKQTECYCLSNCFDKNIPADANHAWCEIVSRLEQLWRQAGGADFPSQAWSILGPVFAPRLAGDMEKAQQYFAASYAGFAYEYHGEYFGPQTPEYLTLHFRNYFAPDSPFRHCPELIRGLTEICSKSLSDRPDVRRVQCASWLNNLEPFYRLFPSGWHEKAVVCPYGPHTGCWGQFIDRNGAVSRHKAEEFKTTGNFQFANVHAQCDLLELKQHLECLGRRET